MTIFIRSIVLGVAAWMSLLVVMPVPVQADDYWNGYWGWYDNTYRPYYYHQYSRPTFGAYYGSSGPYPRYYGAPYPGYYSGYGYGYVPSRTYYGTPGVGVAVGPRGGGAVNVGPLQFGWR
jgi:hypothetical protein